jgi:hypothetical protein
MTRNEMKSALRDKKPKSLWILMHHGSTGWMPSMDYFCAWGTKKAATQKIKELGKMGKNYYPFRYTAGI